MKFSAALILISFSSGAFAVNAAQSSPGNPLPLLSYKTAAACKAAQGDWQEELCWFVSANEFDVNTPVEILTNDAAVASSQK